VSADSFSGRRSLCAHTPPRAHHHDRIHTNGRATPSDTLPTLSEHDVALSPDGTRIATASSDYYACSFDSITGEKRAKWLNFHTMNAVVFSPDGTRVATASSGGDAHVWDSLGTYMPIHLASETQWCGDSSNCHTHRGEVIAVTFGPDGTQVATAGYDMTVRVFDLIKPFQLGLNEPACIVHNGRVNALVFSPDGARVATACSDRAARIFDVNGGAERACLVHEGPVNAVAFSPDGTRIVTASGDKTARVFDAQTGAERTCLPHNGWVNAVAVSPDGTLVATASSDRTARVFEADNGAEHARLAHAGPVTAVAFSPEGNRIVTASGITAAVWLLNARIPGDNATTRRPGLQLQ